MTFKHLLLLMLPTIFLTVGCDKKSTSSKTSDTPLPSQVKETTTSSSDDSAEVFDKYYKDAPAQTDKKTDKTFSMNSPESYTPRFSNRGKYIVQVASMSNATLAEELATELREKGHPAYVTETTNPTGSLTGIFFRVRIGNFPTLSDAKAFGENILVPEKYEYWVDKKINETPSAANESNSGNYPSGRATPGTNSPWPTTSPSSSTSQTPSPEPSSEESARWRSDTATGW